MKVKPLTRKIEARALTNPDPAFVSLCTGPANQEPFRAVRQDDNIATEADMNLKTTKNASSVSAIAPAGFGVMQFQFQKTKFKTAEEVTQWLTDGGYSDFEIVETAKTFEVTDSEGKYEVGTTEVIKGASEGVDAYVGALAAGYTQTVEGDEAAPEPTQKAADPVEPAPEADPVEPTPAQKTEGEAEPVEEPASSEPTQKADDGDGQHQSQVPAEGDAPAQADEPTEEQQAAARAEVVEKISALLLGAMNEAEVEEVRKTVVTKMVSGWTVGDVAEVLQMLRYLIADADYVGMDDTTASALKAAATNVATAMVGLATQMQGDVAELVSRSAKELASKAGITPVVTAEPTSEQPSLADAIRAAVDEAVGPLNERVERAEQEAREARETAAQAQRELAERVEAEETRSQSRKAAADIDAPPPPATIRQRSQGENTMLAAFGSRHANR